MIMNKSNFLFGALILSVLLNNCVSTPDKIQEKKVSISYTWSRIHSKGSNQLAVWIEDSLGNPVVTLFATEYTASGGYIKRPIALSEWTEKFDLKNSSREEVDAITGATPRSGKQSLTWNGSNKSGKIVPPGKYVVRMEANIHDADKMFFRGEIKIGGSDQKTSGEITFSNPVLASGDVLFKDVLVEYR
jgi:hypothetical protein